MDDQPIALRKKRRSSSIYIAGNSRRTAVAGVAPESTQAPTPSTPGRPKKKVRFSDPGPALLSTGITPFLQRTSFEFASRSPPPRGSPEPRGQSASRRSASHAPTSPPRRSLPAASSAPWLGGEFEGQPIEFTFTPLRQALTPRKVRQLKRRHLSEEMNDIESDMKLALKQERRIQELEDELQANRNAFKLAKQGEPSKSSQSRIHELQVEIEDLRKQLQAHPSTPGPMTPSDAFDMMDITGQEPASPCSTIPFSDDKGYEIPSPASSPGPRTPTTTAGVQADLPHPEISAMEQHHQTQRQHLVDARLEMERLLPGETPLPLSPSPDADVSPMLSALLGHLQTAMTEVGRVQKLLKASEAQETKLRSEFNKSLKQFESARSYNKLLETNLGKVNKIFLNAKAKATAQLDKANQQVKDLEQEKSESQHSMSSLRNALEKYRTDVKDLEDLVNKMESKHAKMLKRLQESHNQEKSDLEAHRDAETRGRREAETSVESLELKVNEVESVNRELRQAVHQKQKALRQLESDWEHQRELLEQEVGALNVRLSEAQGKAGELEEQVRFERQRTCEAVERVVEGARLAGEDAVRETASAHGGEISFGLLTPQVEGGRFIDVVGSHIDGKVETKRGKASKKRRHPDSGIGILEEDESELLSSEL